MRIKWNGKQIYVRNKACGNKNNTFYAEWNGYTITANRDEFWKNKSGQSLFQVWCHDPDGGNVLRGALYDTMKEAVQDCFTRIKIPYVRKE